MVTQFALWEIEYTNGQVRPSMTLELWFTASEAIYPEWSGLGQDYQFHYIFVPASN